MIEESQVNFGEKIDEAVKIAETTVRHPYFIKLARIGFYTKGYLFIIIGALAVFVAFGLKNGKLTAPNGALATIAQLPFGVILLILFIIGAIGHGLWNILRGVTDVDDAGKKIQGIIKRSVSVGVGVFYFILAISAGHLLITSRSEFEDGEIQRTITSIILSLPLGSLFMVLVGLGIIIGGISEFYNGISGNFKKNLQIYKIQSANRKIIDWLGYLSFTARALILGMMGYYFIWAAIDYDPSEAIGMDGALKTLSQTYYGKTLLIVAAVGLISHGFLALYEGRYRRIC